MEPILSTDGPLGTARGQQDRRPGRVHGDTGSLLPEGAGKEAAKEASRPLLAGMNSASSGAPPQHKQVLLLQAMGQAVNKGRRLRIPEKEAMQKRSRKWRGEAGQGRADGQGGDTRDGKSTPGGKTNKYKGPGVKVSVLWGGPAWRGTSKPGNPPVSDVGRGGLRVLQDLTLNTMRSHWKD